MDGVHCDSEYAFASLAWAAGIATVCSPRPRPARPRSEIASTPTSSHSSAASSGSTGGEDPEPRQDLAGETYFRFCALLEAYDPSRGVPLRPYLVRQLTASVYTFARQQWNSRKREVSLELRIQEGDEGAGSGTGHGGAPGAAARLSDLPAFGACAWASDPTPGWAEAILRKELLSGLPHLIAKLPPRQQHVLVSRYYE